MYLKSIEVQGFKSFANKILFQFDDGITGIVGPNGSGKSNVADAVRWVLGEQSAKQLRGSNMQDVIFSGTQNRRALGYAFVAITLDNSDHVLPVDYQEVVVSRRVYRSGESEYLLNGNQCRLKDVQELFYDTGIGKEGYSIIGQGQIDRILSGKPEERRELFDEAAGIVKFKKRKNIAVKKLDNESQNLLRISDVLNELEKQVGPLEKQSDKAREYLKFKEELKIFDIHSFLLESESVKNKLTEIKSSMQIVCNDLEESKLRSESLKQQYEASREKTVKLDEELNQLRNNQSETQILQENLTGQIQVLNEQIRHEEENHQQILTRIAAIDGQVKDFELQKSAYVAQKALLNEQLDSLDDEQTQLKEKVEERDDLIRSIDFSIAQNKELIIEILNEKSSLTARAERYETMLEQIKQRKKEMQERLNRTKKEEAQTKLALEQLMKDNEEAESLLRFLTQTMAAQNNDLHSTRQERNALRDRVTEISKEATGFKSRLDSLRNLAERYEGFGQSVRRLMEVKERFPGITGTVADLVRTDKKYEVAIETAIGGMIQNVVTDTAQTAKACIQYLKDHKFGRATFLPLSNIKPKHFNKEALLKEPGVIGIGSDLLQVDQSLSVLSRYLLGNVLVVDHIDHAMAISKKEGASVKIVTLDGEVIQAGGAMSGGVYKNSSSLIGRQRELEELETSLKKSREELEKTKIILSQQEEALIKLKDSLNELDKKRQEQELILTELRLNVTTLKDKQLLAEKGEEDLNTEDRQIKEQLEMIKAEKEKLKHEEKALADKQKNINKDVLVYSKSLEKEKSLKGEADQQLADKTLEFSNLSQKSDFLLENIQRIKKDVKRLTDEKETIVIQITSLKESVFKKQHTIKEVEDNIAIKKEEMEKLDDSIKRLIGKKEEVTSQESKSIEERDELTNKISHLEKDLFRLESKEEKLNEQRENFIEYLWEEYQLTPVMALEQRDESITNLSEIKRKINELKNAIRELGSVNVNAIEEFKEVSQRYHFMKAQHDDLLEAKENLIKVIEELDVGMREQFEIKFKDIKLEFDSVFRDLFGGGKGSLELTEEEDILEAGIQIIAQPPGKKLQNMMQLSGGEKALTAICLLFAIQNLKPSPFCLLDEIEAALDDANINRYASYLQRLKKQTQFIIITHRRGTMQIADRLYGITMQEKGISTLITVDLTDQAGA